MPRAPVASPARAQCPQLGLWQGLGLGAQGHGAVPGDLGCAASPRCWACRALSH